MNPANTAGGKDRGTHLSPGYIVAGCEYIFLLDTEGERAKARLLVFDHGCIKAVVVLWVYVDIKGKYECWLCKGGRGRGGWGVFHSQCVK